MEGLCHGVFRLLSLITKSELCVPIPRAISHVLPRRQNHLVPCAAISLALAAALWATKWSGFGRRLLIGGLVAYVVCGLAPVSDALLLPLENRFGRTQLDLSKPITGFIVLGGVEQRPMHPPRELAGLTGTAERITEAIALARPFPEAQIVFAGDTNKTSNIGQLFEALGVPREDRKSVV